LLHAGENNGSTMRQYTAVHFKKAYNSVRREVLYNILIEFEVAMKLVRLIKMCLNEHIVKSVFLSKIVSNMEMLYDHCFSTLL
jgi:hypothetical protein